MFEQSFLFLFIIYYLFIIIFGFTSFFQVEFGLISVSVFHLVGPPECHPSSIHLSIHPSIKCHNNAAISKDDDCQKAIYYQQGKCA
jgi:hypothetical protein